MASHHLADETFSCEFDGPDIQAHVRCPPISFPHLSRSASGVQLLSPRCYSPSLCPVLRVSIQEMKAELPKRGHMPESRRKKIRALSRFP
jgi:hypothetical protein